jgi:hypothetical protein
VSIVASLFLLLLKARNSRITCRYKAYREEQDALHQAWLVRKKEWEEKKARGEKVGRLERDPTAPVEVGPLELVKFLLLAVILFFLAGKFYTGDFMWDYKTKWTTLKAYIPVSCY